MIIIFEIETKNLKINDELKRKIDMICRFAYVKPHILKVKGNDYLILEEYNKFIIGLSIDCFLSSHILIECEDI